MTNLTITLIRVENMKEFANNSNRKKALEIARVFNLEHEVQWCIDFCGMTPQEALQEWDLI